MAAGKKKKKKSIKWIVLGIVLILIIVLISQCGKSTNQLKTVDVTKVTSGEVDSVLDTSGTIASEETKIYVSPVTAEIAEVNAKVGQEVKKGDYLITYDTSSLESSYTLADLQAKAASATNADTINKSNENAQEAANEENTISSLNSQITAAQTDAANAQAAVVQNQTDSTTVSAQISDYQNKIQSADSNTSETDLASWKKAVEDLTAQANTLSAQATALQSDLETKNASLASLQTDLATAQSKKEAAEAGVMSENAKASLSYSSKATSLSVTNAENDLSVAKAGVAADFDGIVTSVDAVAGSAAAEGQTLVTVANSSAMKVDFQVSKYNLEDLKTGQKVTVTALDHTYEGTVSSISKIATQDASGSTSGVASGSAAMVAAEVHIDNPDSNLILGMDAKLSISLGSVKDALVVPIAAVNTDTDGDFVYVVEKNVVKKKAITTGLYGKEQVEIKEGLKKGAHVISTVDSDIDEGITVVENLVKD